MLLFHFLLTDEIIMAAPLRITDVTSGLLGGEDGRRAPCVFHPVQLLSTAFSSEWTLIDIFKGSNR